MRGNPTAATLLTVPAFLQKRVRTKYVPPDHRPAQDVLCDMQRVIIRFCHDRWAGRQMGLAAYRAEHDIWIQSRRSGRHRYRPNKQNKRRRTDGEADRRVARRMEDGQRTLMDMWDPGPPAE